MKVVGWMFCWESFFRWVLACLRGCFDWLKSGIRWVCGGCLLLFFLLNLYVLILMQVVVCLWQVLFIVRILWCFVVVCVMCSVSLLALLLEVIKQIIERGLGRVVVSFLVYLASLVCRQWVLVLRMAVCCCMVFIILGC